MRLHFARTSDYVGYGFVMYVKELYLFLLDLATYILELSKTFCFNFFKIAHFLKVMPILITISSSDRF